MRNYWAVCGIMKDGGEGTAVTTAVLDRQKLLRQWREFQGRAGGWLRFALGFARRGGAIGSGNYQIVALAPQRQTAFAGQSAAPCLANAQFLLRNAFAENHSNQGTHGGSRPAMFRDAMKRQVCLTGYADWYLLRDVMGAYTDARLVAGR